MIVEIPSELTKNQDDLPTQINFVIAYSCKPDECVVQQAMDVLRANGEAEIIDMSLGLPEEELVEEEEEHGHAV